MDDANAVELYRKHRPKLFKDLIGQPEAVKILKEMVENNRIPHAVMLSGPSGVGKTTSARILRNKLKCGDMDFCEVNCADFRGIDMVRDLRQQIGISPMQGPCRIWLIDEAQKLSSDAQDAMLKMLEDCPKHVYFFLCTTEPDKLKPAIRTRCTHLPLKALSRGDLTTVVTNACAKEKINVTAAVVEKIVEVAEGSARKALVILGQIMGLKTEREQLDSIFPDETKKKAFDLAKLLMDKRSKWEDVMAMIDKIEEDPEAIRHCVMGYASGCLRRDKTPGRGYLILEAFKGNFYDSKKNGLIWACAEVYRQE